MTQAVRPNAANARIAIALSDDLGVAAIFKPRQLELFFDDVEELIELEFKVEGMFAGLITRLASLTVLFAVAGERGPWRPFALTHPAALFIRETKPREFDPRHRDLYCPLPLPPDEVLVADVVFEVLADRSPDDLTEPRMILIDAEAHSSSLAIRSRRSQIEGRSRMEANSGRRPETGKGAHQRAIRLRIGHHIAPEGGI